MRHFFCSLGFQKAQPQQNNLIYVAELYKKDFHDLPELSIEIEQEKFQNTYSNIFNLSLTPETQALNEKIELNSEKIGKVFDIQWPVITRISHSAVCKLSSAFGQRRTL